MGFNQNSDPGGLHTINPLLPLLRPITSLILDAMKALIAAEVITAFWVSRPPNGHAKDKILVIWKERGSSPQEPIPPGGGE